jgi:hypothetical protein
VANSAITQPCRDHAGRYRTAAHEDVGAIPLLAEIGEFFADKPALARHLDRRAVSEWRATIYAFGLTGMLLSGVALI